MSSIRFGTSGLRGLASELLGQAGHAHVAAFLDIVDARNAGAVLIGRDLRASSPELAGDCARAANALGVDAIDCGTIPTPALALHSAALGLPAIMVSGSHIPADRNGLKFYRPGAEIDKADETAIASGAAAPFAALTGPPAWADDNHAAALAAYRARCALLAPPGALAGLRIGVFAHSAVGANLLSDIIRHAGAETVVFGTSSSFVPVDTEALGDRALAHLPHEVRARRLDALVSTDADGDRPLLLDETGAFVRGDALGAIAAQRLGADAVATPVTSNSALESALAPATMRRTRVGSPFVIAAMDRLRREGSGRIVGFEANGGTLLGTDLALGGGTLAALPTRDAALPLLCVLLAAREAGRPVSSVVKALGLRPTAADRLTGIDPAGSARFLASLNDRAWAENALSPLGPITAMDVIDGVRFGLDGGRTLHFRASGNAPELRCYAEAPDETTLRETLVFGLDLARREISAVPKV